MPLISELVHRIAISGSRNATQELSKVDSALEKTAKRAAKAGRAIDQVFTDAQGRLRWRAGSSRGGQFVTMAERAALGMGGGGGGLLSGLLGRGGGGSHNIEASIGRMTGAMSDATTMAWRMGLAFSASSLGIGALLKQMDNFEQNEVAFETMLQSTEKAQKLLGELQQFARRTPFNFSQVTELSKRLLAFSFTAEELIPTMNDLGNVASGVGKEKLPQLILALGQVRTAGLLRGQELRQFTEAGVPLIEELAKTTGRAKKEIMGMISAGQISYDMVRESIANMSKEGSRFHNLMIRQSRTLGGLFGNTVDYLQMLLIKLGKRGLLQESKNYITGLIDLLETNEEDILQRTDQVVKSILKGMRGVMNVFKAAGHVFKAFASIVGGTENAINLLIASLTLLAGARMLSMLGNFTMGMWGAVRAMLALQGTALLIPLAIGAAVAAIALIAEDIIGYFQGRQSVTGMLLNNFDEIATKIAGKADQIGKSLREKSKEIASAIGAVLKDPQTITMVKEWIDVALIASGAAASIGVAVAQGIIEGLTGQLINKDNPGFLDDMMAGVAGLFGLNALEKGDVSPATASIGLVDEVSQGNIFQRMFSDMTSAFTGSAPINVTVGDIVVPPGMTAEQATKIVSDGVAGGLTKAEVRQAARALSSPVAQ